jgi:hypothetical protein
MNIEACVSLESIPNKSCDIVRGMCAVPFDPTRRFGRAFPSWLLRRRTGNKCDNPGFIMVDGTEDAACQKY